MSDDIDANGRGAPAAGIRAGGGEAGGLGFWPLVAHATSAPNGFVPEPAPKKRAWMDATPHKFARRCLPLTIANQAGWVIRVPFGVRARWNGGDALGNVEVQVLDPAHPARGWVSDHFGAGILTFSIPYVFRTPPGVALLVRGAPNFWVEGAHALEGLVETDWSVASFTMNWRIVRANRWVEFSAGDPICFLQPVSVATIETAEPVILELGDDPDLEHGYRAWAASRDAFNADSERDPRAWQKEYYQGKKVTGEAAGSHRTRVRVAGFAGAPEAEVRPLRVVARSAGANGSPRSSHAAALDVTGVQARWHVVDDFYDDAGGLRAAVEDHLAGDDGRGAERGIWDVFHVEGQYAYLRTPAERVIASEALTRYRGAVSAWGWENLGIGRLTSANLSLYLPGCAQGLHNDAGGAFHAFVHSFSPAVGFTGGETMLVRTDPYWGTSRTGRPGAGTDFVEKVAPAFNRLLVFDTRLIHGVETVHGSWNPSHGRLVLQGQFLPGGLRLTGRLSYSDAAGSLRDAARRIAEQVPELAESVRAAVGVRLDVGADGRVSEVSVLSAWVAPLTEAGIPSDLIDRIIATLSDTAFAGGPGTATFSVPIDDLGSENPCLRKVADFEIEESPDGFVVTDLDGERHHLNHSALFILECCTGDADPGEIARTVQDAYGLPDPPHDLVEQCLGELHSGGLITDSSSETADTQRRS